MEIPSSRKIDSILIGARYSAIQANRKDPCCPSSIDCPVVKSLALLSDAVGLLRHPMTTSALARIYRRCAEAILEEEEISNLFK